MSIYHNFKNGFSRSLVPSSDDPQDVSIAQVELITEDPQPGAAARLLVVHSAPHVSPVFSGRIGVEGVTLSFCDPYSLPGSPLGSAGCNTIN